MSSWEKFDWWMAGFMTAWCIVIVLLHWVLHV